MRPLLCKLELRYPMRKAKFEELVEIMENLLGEKGCPWDKEQDHNSLRQYLIEEAYEVIEAIDTENYDELKEELGDLLLQIVFHSELARKNKKFDIYEVIGGICDKLIERHPHIFGDVKVSGSREVLINWEMLKKSQKREKGKSILSGVPKELPGLLRAHRIQEKAARVGFDWSNFNDVLNKVEEEIKELREISDTQDINRIEEEIGDMFFALVNVARFKGVNSEYALRKMIDKFIRRFNYIETKAEKLGKELKDMTLKEMDDIWEESKGNE